MLKLLLTVSLFAKESALNTYWKLDDHYSPVLCDVTTDTNSLYCCVDRNY